MRGIILAGGSGKRLYPLTDVMCKQCMPIYNKPLIYFPLSVLMLAGIEDILIISTPTDIPVFKKLFKDSSKLGINLEFAEQKKPTGIPAAFVIGEDFIKNDSVCLILGDNIIFGHNLPMILRGVVNEYDNKVFDNDSLATIFGYHSNTPEKFGIAEVDGQNNVLSLEEKPKFSKSNLAVIGLYFYTNDVIEYAKNLKPSPRGETEITDLNKIYLENKNLKLKHLGRGFSWIDTGNVNSMLEASNYIKNIETMQSFQIGCIEEIAFNNGTMSRADLLEIGNKYPGSEYGQYLIKIANQEN